MGDSPPPTPPARRPEDHELRFKHNGWPCEWIENYHPGGYHPVNLGDLFCNGRYKVLRKLGYGSFSTVWLARDSRDERYVALKIVESKSTEGALNELRILAHITKVAPTESRQFITQLLDEFEHHGPNGIHKCLVFEPMGPCVNLMVRELPDHDPRDGRYPPQVVKNIFKQSLEAMSFLHKNGISQSEFHPGNMLFAIDDIHSQPEDVMWQKEDGRQSASPLIQRKDGKQDKWAPRHLYMTHALTTFTPYAKNLKIKLTDMGGAYFLVDPPNKVNVPQDLRAPELILTGDVSEKLDIWSFGCLLFELLTGQRLCSTSWMSGSEADDSYLLQLTERLGPLPDKLYKHWKTSHLYFTPERKLYNDQVGGERETDDEDSSEEEPEGETVEEESVEEKLETKRIKIEFAKGMFNEHRTMEDIFDKEIKGMEEEDARKAKALIRRVLQYDPAKRPSAEEILADPWFSDIQLSGHHYIQPR